MTSISPGLRAWIDAHASSAGAPVYIGHAKQDTAIPYIVIQRVRTERYETMDDSDDDSLIAETFRITVYAETDEECHEPADAIATALVAFTGAMGSDRVCEAVYLEDESAEFAPPEFVDGLNAADVIVLIQHSPA